MMKTNIFRRKYTQGFTLVELSIVLVILGLLVGGVLAGQSLIRAAELRSITTQYSTYVAAVNSFRDKYFALPGDMTNAQSFWGVAHATPATCYTTASTTTATCNGDGNGAINTAAPGSDELFRFWQHLANAGLIEGSYSGVAANTNNWSASRANVPSGKLGNSLWHSQYWGDLSGLSFLFNGNYDAAFLFGAFTTNSDPGTAVLKPEELWNIDTKMDDGRPTAGKIVPYAIGGLSTCTDTASPTSTTASYLLNSAAVSCAIMFRRSY